jgi:archaemetzincin
MSRRIRRRDFAGLGVLALLSALAPNSAAAETVRVIQLQPLGPPLAELDLDFVRRSVLAFYRVEIRMAARRELPRSAFYAKRQRYRAEKLLRHLADARPRAVFRALGLTTADISTTKPPYEDWGILGLADLDGPACVVSKFRTQRGAKNPEHARIRLGKTVVHELGHTFGLPHCTTPGCLMEDAGGSVLTTDREYDLCAICRERLKRAGHELSDSGAIPWPKPES